MAQTIPGGYYIGANGRPHDANGKPLPPLPDSNVSALPVTTETVAPVLESVSVRDLTDPNALSDIPVDEPVSAKPKRTPKAK